MAKRSEIVKMFKTFMADTTIHGCRYIVDDRFHIIANIVWGLIEIAAFSIGIFLVIVNIKMTRHIFWRQVIFFLLYTASFEWLGGETSFDNSRLCCVSNV